MSFKRKAASLYRKVQGSINGHLLRRSNVQKVNNRSLDIPKLTGDDIEDIRSHWQKYGIKPDLNSFRWFYYATGNKDWRFIPEDIYVRFILYRCNDLKSAGVLSDKNLFDRFIERENLVETLVHNINGVYLDTDYRLLSFEDVLRITGEEDELVIKPTVDTGKGKGVARIAAKDLEKTIPKYKKDFALQRKMVQHPQLAALNESSVNVVRITSFLWKGKVHVLAPCVRVGAAGNFTDHLNIAIGLDENGCMFDSGLTVSGEKVSILPNGYVFGGKQIPGYEDMVEIVKRVHPRLARFKLIAWDISTDIHGIARVIEYNLVYPGLSRYQECNGPFFGDLTDEVLSFYLGNGAK